MWLARRARDLGFDEPVRVQAVTLPPLLNGSDAVIQAQTGSGKTLAYLMPLLAGVETGSVTTQAIVMVPTRELGLQVSRVARQLAAGSGPPFREENHDLDADADADAYDADAYDTDPTSTTLRSKRILVMSLLEGSRNRRQRAWAWAEPPHVVVANPVTLEKMLATGGLRVNDLKFLVVDEVDACADMSSPNGPALRSVLGKHLSPSFGDAAVSSGAPSPGTRPQRQSVFLSASVPQPKHFVRQCVQRRWCLQEKPAWINVNADDDTVRTPPQIEHWYLVTTMERKFGSLRGYLRREAASKRLKRAIVFVNPGRPLDQMAVALDRDLATQLAGGAGEEGILEEGGEATTVVGVLAEDKGLNSRASVMDGFRDGDHRILLATDMAARGLDVPDTSHVIMFDMPPTAESYLHRAGRTGRMGRPGVVVTLASKQEVFVVERLGNALSVAIAPISGGH